MISIRKHIDAYALESVEAPLDAYREILLSIARAAGEATPYLGEHVPEKFKALNQALESAPAPDRMREVHREAEREIAAWSQSASGYLRDKAKEVKEIILALANTAASTAERDQRYTGRLNDLTTSLESVARLEDLTSVRRSLLENAAELKSCADRMASESAAAIAQLSAELAAYRSRLEDAERRELMDTLTALLNRRGLESRIEERILSGCGFSVAMLDVNGFKSINDQHGHIAGDDLLRQFAGELQTQFRPGIVGRWGGDEFLAIVPGAVDEVRRAMERVRRWAFGSYRLKISGKSISVSVVAAAGLAQWDGRESSLDLLARADQQMYLEKPKSRQAVLAG